MVFVGIKEHQACERYKYHSCKKKIVKEKGKQLHTAYAGVTNPLKPF